MNHAPLPTAFKVLLGAGAVGMSIGWSLFIRMAVELNRALPQEKKFSILELRMNFHEVKRLHEEIFPVSAIRVTRLALMVSSVITLAAAILVGIMPTY